MRSWYHILEWETSQQRNLAERENGAPASRLKSYLESLAFCLHTFGMDELRRSCKAGDFMGPLLRPLLRMSGKHHLSLFQICRGCTRCCGAQQVGTPLLLVQYSSAFIPEQGGEMRCIAVTLHLIRTTLEPLNFGGRDSSTQVHACGDLQASIFAVGGTILGCGK